MQIKRMGVMNVTPNSFSDGNELSSLGSFQTKFKEFQNCDAIDIGAESTAPMNGPITYEEEWERLLPFISSLKNLQCPLSLDTYHPETIFKIGQNWKGTLIWNDVSGKIDLPVKDFLKLNENFHYVFCHNLAPTRELANQHMQHLSKAQNMAFIEELADFFKPHIHPRIIFDPCLGFSKTYEQNWFVLDHFAELQKRVPHHRWLIGLSRKSFLRKKYNLTLESREELDRVHVEEVKKLYPSLTGEIWIRTHRPEIL